MCPINRNQVCITEDVRTHQSYLQDHTAVVITKDVHTILVLFAKKNGLSLQQTVYLFLKTALQVIREQYPDLKVPRA